METNTSICIINRLVWTNSGGLKVIKGFHNKIDKYFNKNITESTIESGEFYRLNSKSHALLIINLYPVNAPKGSLVCWIIDYLM
jgi:hypothetical protein